MLTLTVLGREHFDEESGVFTTMGDVTLELEHSLVSLSKWESIVEKPFLTREEKSTEEVYTYIRCMMLTQDPPPDILDRFTKENFEEIQRYIDSKQTATWFNEPKNSPPSREVITSELIYFWMFQASIPIECETWPLNRLFTLLKVFAMKNGKQKKMSHSEVAARNRELNAQRRRQLGTSG